MTVLATLEAAKRAETGKGAARKIRAAGRVPGVVYGQGGEALMVTVDAQEADRLFQSISVENTIVDLSLEGDHIRALVREVQVHPIRPGLLHIDFYRVQKGMAVDVDIPVHLNGTPVGVKMHGGILQQVVHELPVRTIPSLIPESIEIDVSELDLGDSLRVAEIPATEGVEIMLEAERTVCTVSVPRAVVEEVEEVEEAEEGVEGEEEAAAAESEASGETSAGEDRSEG